MTGAFATLSFAELRCSRRSALQSAEPPKRAGERFTGIFIAEIRFGGVNYVSRHPRRYLVNVLCLWFP